MNDEILQYRPYQILIDVYDVEKTLRSFDFKAMRNKSGFSLRKVAELTGISNPYLSQLETGKVLNPSFRVVMLLLKLYDVRYA